MIKRRTTINVQTQRLSVIRSAGEPIELWCKDCGAIVPMFVPERLAALLHTSSREIYRRVEAGELHFVETDSGELLICSLSLPRARAMASASGEGLRDEDKEEKY